MATVSNASSGATMSNTQAGTRLTSSSDWTRLKKLRNIYNQGYNGQRLGQNTNPIIYSRPILVPRTTGSSRYKNVASDWMMANKSAQFADYVTQAQNNVNTPAKTLTRIKLCDCTTSTLSPRFGLCLKCKYSRT